jgi:Predicted metal-sulfur cluster biosynthetic enzyme
MVTPAPLPTQVEVALGDVIDPELGLSIVELGLVYGVAYEDGLARVTMTTTSPICPLGAYLAGAVEERLLRIPGVDRVEVVLVDEPPWGPERMSAGARRALGWEVPDAPVGVPEPRREGSSRRRWRRR